MKKGELRPRKMEPEIVSPNPRHIKVEGWRYINPRSEEHYIRIFCDQFSYTIKTKVLKPSS